MTAQWVMYPAGNDQDAVGIAMLDVEGTPVISILMLKRAVAAAMAARGIEADDEVDPAYSCPLPQLRNQAAAVRATENIARGAVSGRVPVYPLTDPDVEQSWKSIVGMAVALEMRVN